MNAEPAVRARRDPEATRTAVLDAAFEEMYSKGFRAAGVDGILAQAGATKGALYHHFGNKQQLGYAVVEERVKPLVRERYILPFETTDDPIEALHRMGLRMEEELLKVGILEKGCPLNNLIQEMSGVDEGFRARLSEVLDEWAGVIADRIRVGQAKGTVDATVDPDELAAFTISGYLGAVGLAKNAQHIEPFTASRRRLDAYAETLRTTRQLERSRS